MNDKWFVAWYVFCAIVGTAFLSVIAWVLIAVTKAVTQ